MPRSGIGANDLSGSTPRPAGPSGRRGATCGLTRRPARVLGPARPVQHRTRSTLGRGLHVGPRGQHQDPDGPVVRGGILSGRSQAETRPAEMTRGGADAGAPWTTSIQAEPSPWTRAGAPPLRGLRAWGMVLGAGDPEARRRADPPAPRPRRAALEPCIGSADLPTAARRALGQCQGLGLLDGPPRPTCGRTAGRAAVARYFPIRCRRGSPSTSTGTPLRREIVGHGRPVTTTSSKTPAASGIPGTLDGWEPPPGSAWRFCAVHLELDSGARLRRATCQRLPFRRKAHLPSCTGR